MLNVLEKTGSKKGISNTRKSVNSAGYLNTKKWFEKMKHSQVFF